MTPIHVGSLVYGYQAIDIIAPLDLISSGSKSLVQSLRKYAPINDNVIDNAPDFTFHHIGLNLDPVHLTAGIVILPTCTVDNAPELDILILGGPGPAGFKLDPKFTKYIQHHVALGKLLFTNCTGAFVAAEAGVLSGRTATVNHVEYEWVKKRHPSVNWTNNSKWVVDGNIWTASGAVAGMDMVAHWIKENYGMEVLIMAAMGLEYEPRNSEGILDVIPKRYDPSGKQISTHVFKYYESY
ncbi:hypothetical protein BFJ72_g15251 [Fusarium proliferatum]|uniref:DJ-1/PfpI domain-containing protein n=1 Tax=Gibberella intermedia TaxID=948311 RepID=A0A420RM52_GIBIN|nr:DJ-1/PfpI family protein [Fusarium proliferatum]RKL18098.1 hypothetical protein BFJ72_g15251 [Fusarium proliferatum]